jgi:uncharacterized protein YbjT (DUF2867 family)
MIITVAGATGKSGAATVRTLSGGGKCDEIRAVVRDPERETAKALARHDKVKLIQGDFQNLESLKQSVKGAQRAFLVSTAGTDQQSENEINFIKACQAEGIEFIVRISTVSSS